MREHYHNFMRMWTWELSQWNTSSSGFKNENLQHFVTPHIWPRTGNEKALDGKPKFDLSQYDRDYFDRMRSRITAAGDRGIYVSVMLFEGWERATRS